MDIEKLYQDVWAQVFALAWNRNDNLGPSDRAAVSTNAAHHAAEYAVKLFDPAKAHAAICAAQGLPAPEGT